MGFGGGKKAGYLSDKETEIKIIHTHREFPVISDFPHNDCFYLKDTI